MDLRATEQLSKEYATSQGERKSSISSDDTSSANSIIKQYLLQNVPEFQKLHRVQEEVWKSPDADIHFSQQQHIADNAKEDAQKFFYKLMFGIAKEMHKVTQVFRLSSAGDGPPAILDTCMAPGGMLKFALDQHPKASASCFSLPQSKGGHKARLPDTYRASTRYLDLNMLAEDLGASAIRPEHPDAADFLPRQLQPDQEFDLALCDGQVLRTHSRAEYREVREARRLLLAQLALALEHLKPGGTMIVLLHKVGTWESVFLMYQFSKFSALKLFKPRKAHAKRSSFYMLCFNVQSMHSEAVAAVENWKREWRVATFGNDDEYNELTRMRDQHVEHVRDRFGSELVRHGRIIWAIQTKALTEKFLVP